MRDRVPGPWTGERRPAGEQFVEQHTGAVEVDGQAGLAGEQQFRRQILRGADQTGRRRLAILEQTRDAEVRQLHLPVRGQQHIVRFDVAVQHLLPVRVHETVQHRGGDLDSPAGSQWPIDECGAQRATADVLHHDRQLLALGDQVADRDDSGVPEPDQDRAFAQESAHQFVVGHELRPQQLRRDRLLGTPVDAAPDLARRPAPDQLRQPVRRTQGAVGTLGWHGVNRTGRRGNQTGRRVTGHSQRQLAG